MLLVFHMKSVYFRPHINKLSPDLWSTKLTKSNFRVWTQNPYYTVLSDLAQCHPNIMLCLVKLYYVRSYSLRFFFYILSHLSVLLGYNLVPGCYIVLQGSSADGLTDSRLFSHNSPWLTFRLVWPVNFNRTLKNLDVVITAWTLIYYIKSQVLEVSSYIIVADTCQPMRKQRVPWLWYKHNCVCWWQMAEFKLH